MTTSVSMIVTRLTSPPDDLAATRCPHCESDPDLFQPDVEQPGRLLAVCPDCHLWLILDLEAGLIMQVPRPDAPPPLDGDGRHDGDVVARQ